MNGFEALGGAFILGVLLMLGWVAIAALVQYIDRAVRHLTRARGEE